MFHRNATQKFPDFPDEDDGGSNAIFAKKSVEEVQEELDAVGIAICYRACTVFRSRNSKAKAKARAKAIKKVRLPSEKNLFRSMYFHL